MAYGRPMIFNNSTGSDSAASGIGPSTVVSGSGAYCAGTSLTIDLSMDSPDLSTVAVGDCIYIPFLDGTERCFLEITAVNDISDTVTVSSTVSSSFSLKSWYIGGKRAFGDTAAGRSPFDAVNSDVGGFSCTYEFEYTGTDYSQSAGIIIYESSQLIGTGSQMPKIKGTTNSMNIIASHTIATTNCMSLLHNLWLDNDDTATGVAGVWWFDESITIDSCKFGHSSPTVGLSLAVLASSAIDMGCYLNNCEFTNLVGSAIQFTSSDGQLVVNNCVFDNCTGTYSIYVNNANARCSVTNNAFSNCTRCFNFNQAQRWFVANNAMANCGRGINVKWPYCGAAVGNIITGATTCAYEATGTQNNYNSVVFRDYTEGNAARWSGTAPNTVLIDIGTASVALGSDPFTDAANGDLTLDGTADADTLTDVTAINGVNNDGTDIRPFNFLNPPTGGGGGGSTIIIVEEN